MKAVLLAAGVGARLKPLTETAHKCLTEIGGRSLLVRHLDILSTLPEVEGMHIVIGYLGHQIRDAVAEWQRAAPRSFPVTFTENPLFRKGSILSLLTAAPQLRAQTSIIMDADVLYHPDIMARLVRATGANAVLCNAGSEATGEEMFVCISDEGHARHIARSSDPATQTGWALTGESVGFFKVSQADGPALIAELEAVVAATDDGDRSDYERGVARWMKRCEVVFARVEDRPWTEVDFAEDVAAAESEILPAIEADLKARAADAAS